MRVISQGGAVDVPYETGSFNMICAELVEPKRTIIYYYHSCFGTAIKLAEYSAKAKAIKAMEMLREAYARIEIIKSLASGTCKHMEESLEPEEFKDILKKYIGMEVFQFPQDDEIEV